MEYKYNNPSQHHTAHEANHQNTCEVHSNAAQCIVSAMQINNIAKRIH